MDNHLKMLMIQSYLQWCTVRRFTPLLDARYTRGGQAPWHLAQDGLLTLNIHPDAVENFILDEDQCSFDTQFDGQIERTVFTLDSIERLYCIESFESLGFMPNDSCSHTKNKKQASSHLYLVQ